ncbi:6,7-dimethyl-8-ribityllumazine synthase [Helicobacter ailurogastricus]|uniref:6,7-dimethyl-8-ribityllumazine synthase n=1 Tax=Helicobacter ailurogastricus TaxID=1578720 RepID=A0A0K2X306_9HELI|nr:6,7-dimethyl-8-ribityllumazine synthase [Helicobacter ailurogastricus]CRF40327.1 6,7-dimethyl-8-ribityllumazine synthase [Helicobacter ailurogastricus]CRF42394.1 6,7-dimethyl-8-ribityllumazine synthase [Helicobacter ailurogastricus]CRF44665.1 6,7-dimethyl-8-ribityllumazine synthase [Helicobacter ailurogastricus]CRF52082.1 6,7-dimethyl-8-ribityllumazine synthase [Helicobacter ailurogastricus]BDQ29200.1 6,7-dimethyl-8-ribityllumazine synthase [Helicobacter ailurogastricus]
MHRVLEGQLVLKGSEKVAVLAARFNHLITDRLVEGALDCFRRHGGDLKNLTLVKVPGAYELPFVLDKLLSSKKYDGVCVLGAVIRGSTPHFDYVSAEATKGIANTTLKYGLPVSFGLLTTDNIEQALERAGTKAGNKGAAAMDTLIELLSLYSAF